MNIKKIKTCLNDIKQSIQECKAKQRNADLYWLSFTEKVAEKSVCQKRPVGATIIDKDGRVVGTGYNGHPRKTSKDSVCLRKDIKSGTQMEIGYCAHAEMNALIFTDYKLMQDSKLYLTCAPCMFCAPHIIQAGISELVYYYSKADNPDIIKFITDLMGKDRCMKIRVYNKDTGELTYESDMDL